MIKRLKIYFLHTLMVEAFAYRFIKKYTESKKYKFYLLVELMRAVQKRPKDVRLESVYDHNCLLTRGLFTVFLLEHFRIVVISTDAKTFFNNVFGKTAAVRAPVNESDYPDLVIPEITSQSVSIKNVPQGTVFLLLPHQVKQTINQTSFKKINKYYYEIEINASATLNLGSADDGQSSGYL